MARPIDFQETRGSGRQLLFEADMDPPSRQTDSAHSRHAFILTVDRRCAQERGDTEGKEGEKEREKGGPFPGVVLVTEPLGNDDRQ